MNKAQITKAQGKATTKSIHGHLAALVLDTTTLYYERNSWGKPLRFLKSTQTKCDQNSLGIVTTGHLVMYVSAMTWSTDIQQRVDAAEAFIKNFTGTLADVLNADGTVNYSALPEGVAVSLINNRNLIAREDATEPLTETTVETAEATPEVTEAPAKRLGKAQQRVLNFLASRKGEALTVPAIVKALGELGEKTWYNATKTAVSALVADPSTGVVEGRDKTYTFQG